LPVILPLLLAVAWDLLVLSESLGWPVVSSGWCLPVFFETIRRLCYNKNQGKVPVYRPPPPLMPAPPHWQPDQNP
jgi:hypothetical protein